MIGSGNSEAIDDGLETFYLTFGEKYPWRHGWVEVRAVNYDMARTKVEAIFGNQWGWIYDEEKFDKSVFLAGRIGEVIK